MTLEDAINPNIGWIIAPLAGVTSIAQQKANVDLWSVPEMLYGLAAIIYAIAAYRKAKPQVRKSPPCLDNCPHSRKSSTSAQPSPNDDEDTIDLAAK